MFTRLLLVIALSGIAAAAVPASTATTPPPYPLVLTAQQLSSVTRGKLAKYDITLYNQWNAELQQVNIDVSPYKPLGSLTKFTRNLGGGWSTHLYGYKAGLTIDYRFAVIMGRSPCITVRLSVAGLPGFEEFHGCTKLNK